MTDLDLLAVAVAFDGAGEDERVRAAVAAWLADVSAFGRGLAQELVAPRTMRTRTIRRGEA